MSLAFCLFGHFAHSSFAAIPSVILDDSFAGAAINSTNWVVSLPFSNSSVVPNNGSVTLNNNGQITAKPTVKAPYTVVLEDVTMSDFEVLSVDIRSDGVIPAGEEVAPGIRFTFWNQNGYVNATFYPVGLAGGEGLTSGGFTKSSTYKIKITDDGANFTLWVNDVVIFSGASNLSAGNKITIFNRGTQTGWGIPSSTTIGSVLITQQNEPTDTDLDGVNDYREAKDGTNPNDPNSFKPTSKGLVAYYPTKNSLADESGYSNDLVNPTSGIIFTSGRLGKDNTAVVLSSNSDSVSSINPIGISGNQSHSFSFWLYLPSYPSCSGGEGTLLNIGQGGQHAGDISRIFCDDIAEGGGRMVSSGEYADMELRNLGAQFLGNWHHVVCVYDGSVTGTRIYIDGAGSSLIPWPGGNWVDSRNLISTPFTIGRTGTSAAPAAAPGAALSDIRLYNRALSATEVGQIYQQENDTDGDGIFDIYETNTGIYVSVTDTGTSPNNPDTDGDGLLDGVETATGIYVSAKDTGTNPNKQDTDGDGLADGVETNTGIYVGEGNTGTSPVNEDTNGDGIKDGEAVVWKLNPLEDYTPVMNFLKHASETGSAGRFGIYTSNSITDLNLGALVLQKSGSTVTLNLQLQSKSSMNDAWTNHSTVPMFLDMPGNKTFLRIRALGPQ